MIDFDHLFDDCDEVERFEKGKWMHIAYDWFHANGEHERYEGTVFQRVPGKHPECATHEDEQGIYHWKIVYTGKAADLTTLGVHASLAGFPEMNVHADDWRAVVTLPLSPPD